MTDKTLRILHCVATLDIGGYETLIMNIYRKIDRTKVQFDFLYSFDGVYKEEILKLGGKVYQIPFITQVGPFKYRRSVDRLFKEHKEYSIIHSHMDKFSGLIMEIAKENNISVRIAHSHSTHNAGSFIYDIVKNHYGKKIHYATDRFACSKEAGEWLYRYGEQFTVIKNGVDLNRFKLSDNRNKDVFTIVDVARLSDEKNHMFLLDVFSELIKINQNSRLLLAGRGPLENKLINRCKELNIFEKVEFLGYVDDVHELLNKADVFVLPSKFEGLGISAVEAQASGLNCILSDAIPKEVDITNTCVFLSIKDTPEEWAKTIVRYKGVNKKNNHKQIIENGYDINQTTHYLEKFYYDSINQSNEVNLITVFTPTYNRAYILDNLYKSLVNQTNKKFEWIIADDGSTDNTEELVNKWVNNQNGFYIKYYKQPNIGKSQEINFGVSKAKGQMFFIVDSDDNLPNDSIENIYKCQKTIRDKKDFAGISGYRTNTKGEMIGTTFKEDYVDCTNLERSKHNINGDKSEVFYTRLLKKYPFPCFEGEKFIPEAIVWNRIANDGYITRYFNFDLYHCEYLIDGYTKNIDKLLINNFNGYKLYIKELLQSKASIQEKLIPTMGFIYRYILKMIKY